MDKKKKVVIVGDSAFAEVAYECFTYDSEYEVVGFSVEREFMSKDTLFDLPIIPFESLEDHYSPKDVEFYAALVYTQLNRLRSRLYKEAKEKGYKPASYVSSQAFVWRNVEVGEHCFIFENNTLQPFVRIGSNVVLWSGNHIGHHSIVRDNCFIASQAVISGFCDVGENSFIGVNATLSNNVSIGKDNWVGLGVTINNSTGEDMLFKGDRSAPAKLSATALFKVKD